MTHFKILNDLIVLFPSLFTPELIKVPINTHPALPILIHNHMIKMVTPLVPLS